MFAGGWITVSNVSHETGVWHGPKTSAVSRRRKREPDDVPQQLGDINSCLLSGFKIGLVLGTAFWSPKPTCDQ